MLPVKILPKVTYYVSGGTSDLSHSLTHSLMRSEVCSISSLN